MDRIRCFLLVRLNEGRRIARRFATSSDCPIPGSGYHDAEVILGDETIAESDLEGDFTGTAPQHSDPVWPTECACGYRFKVTDHFQYGYSRLYRHPLTGDKFRLRDRLPVGSMWDAPWLADLKRYGNTDGHCYVVMTPGGQWIIDGIPSGGGRWVRVGEAPNLTVTPSILIHDPKTGKELYHGWLQGGFLVRC